MANDAPHEPPHDVDDESSIDMQFATDDREGLRVALERLRQRMQTEADSGVLPRDNDFDEPTGAIDASDLLDADLQQQAEQVFSAWDDDESGDHLVEFVVEDQDTARVDVSDLLKDTDEPSTDAMPEDTQEIHTEQRQRKVITLTPSSEKVKPAPAAPAPAPVSDTPWTLEQFFNGEIDLDKELSERFDRMPILGTAQFRTLGARSGRRVATLMSQDGGATLIIDVDMHSKAMQLSFTLGAMLTLRFQMTSLSDTDRNRWLELMRRKQGGLAFLWGPERWREDYLICISRQYYTNIYAFSQHNFEAAIRLTPTATKQLLNWFDEVWYAIAEDEDDDKPLLTW